MKGVSLIVGFLCLLVPSVLVFSWVHSASARLQESVAAGHGGAEQGVAVAAPADVGYCSADLKKILRRVLQSCGLLNTTGGRGCQPVEAQNVATVSGADFNALFTPMKDRGGIIQFDLDSASLDPQDTALIDKLFSEQKGASYFFVVSRASPEGRVEHNRDLSKARAEAVLAHLKTAFNDPDLEKEVGLLWLGEEFAQLDQQFCSWQRSGTDQACAEDTLNRSAFVAWIDCTL